MTRSDSTLSASDSRGRKSRGGRVPTLIVALDAEHPLGTPSRHSLAGIDEVRLGRGQPGVRRHRDDGRELLELTLGDKWMSTDHARLVRELDRFVAEDLGSKNGLNVDGTPQQRAVLSDGSLLEVGRTFLLFTEQPGGADPADVDGTHIAEPAPGLRTFDVTFERQLSDLVKIAASKVPVLVRGETGTGKELIARAVHQLSARRGAFTPVNCAAFTESLLSSELFGHKRGAFTGAAEERPGLVRSAHEGTLFLDEVADLSLPGQAALLRALQEGEVLPVGAAAPVRVDLRVVAATHGDLPARVSDGRFRADLYSRLAGFSLELPPLRARRSDLGLLVGALLARIAPGRATQISLSPAAARALLMHGWPLNVRELEQCLAAAVALAGARRIELEHLPKALQDPPKPAAFAETLTDEELRRRDELTALLAEHKGNVSAVSRALGKGRTQVQRWMKRYRL